MLSLATVQPGDLNFVNWETPSPGFALKMYAQLLPPWPFKCPWIHLSEKYAYLDWMHKKKNWTVERSVCGFVRPAW